MTIRLLLSFLFSISLFAQAPDFGSREDKGLIEFSEINEASGIAASKINTNVLWVHNDSGDSARIFAINNSGKHLGVYSIENATNRDWEDIEVGPGPVDNESYIYIGEIGDNSAQYDLKYIYRVPEPVVNPDQNPVYISLGNVDVIKYQYPDGPRDAEALLVDPLTKDIYVVSKREVNVSVYRAAYPQSLTDVITLDKIATLPLTQIVGGDISADGSEILLKNYDFVFYWQRNAQQTITDVFTHNQYYQLPYKREPQGEGICWSYNSDGYYTVSEELLGVPAHLYFYPRVGPNGVDSLKNKDKGSDYFLEQNYPNPFNPVTSIQYAVGNSHRQQDNQYVSLKVYNILGEEIADLLNEQKSPGKYEIVFNAGNYSSGVYFYKLQTDEYIRTKVMTLLK